MRYFVAVAEHGNFTRVAGDLHVAQQAVSQQIRALEATLGVTLLRRNSRKVELTPEGEVFLADARRLLSASDQAVRRVQAADRGETGTLRVVYTILAAYETTPALLERLRTLHPQLEVSAREVYGSQVRELLSNREADVGLVAMTAYPRAFRQRLVRREALRLVVATGHRLAGANEVDLAELKHERFQLWPREMAPGYYDVVVGACRAAGFEPAVDTHGAGAWVWCDDIASGRGVGLIVESAAGQFPDGLDLVDLSPPRPTLAINAVWAEGGDQPAIETFLDAATTLAAEQAWY